MAGHASYLVLYFLGLGGEGDLDHDANQDDEHTCQGPHPKLPLSSRLNTGHRGWAHAEGCTVLKRMMSAMSVWRGRYQVSCIHHKKSTTRWRQMAQNQPPRPSMATQICPREAYLDVHSQIIDNLSRPMDAFGSVGQSEALPEHRRDELGPQVCRHALNTEVPLTLGARLQQFGDEKKGDEPEPLHHCPVWLGNVPHQHSKHDGASVETCHRNKGEPAKRQYRFPVRFPYGYCKTMFGPVSFALPSPPLLEPRVLILSLIDWP